jgi:hypothetical protein
MPNFTIRGVPESGAATVAEGHAAGGKLQRKARNLDGLARLVSGFIPPEIFAGERERVYSPWVTFVAFLGQVLTRGSACRESVRRVQSWCVADRLPLPDESTSAYCQARARLDLAQVKEAHEHIMQWFEERRAPANWCGRPVRVLDGCGVSMPDTAENRKAWPYAGGQKPGCGFPTAQLVGLFCLATGRLVRFAFADWKAHEIPLARQLIAWIQPKEIVLADRAFCGWGFMALLQRKEVDVVLRLHQARRTSEGRVSWTKPQRPAETWDQALWAELPDELQLRVVTFRIEVKGFRTKEVTVVTTLLDEQQYPDSMIAQLYRQRWAVELFFREIKTTLGLDVLRCQSPDLIEKEVWMQVIGYNLVRALMLVAAKAHRVPVDRLSFKGTVDTLRQWTPLLAPALFVSRVARKELLRVIAADQLLFRPNRSEPRACKRRPKVYQLLTRPRRKMVVSPSRNLK